MVLFIYKIDILNIIVTTECIKVSREVTAMNIAAYCRVSTDKTDQLNSLETQKEFFLEYTKHTGDKLIKLYADEDIFGTQD